MLQLKLSAEEKQILIETLQMSFTDLGMEIADTDQQDYREVLKQRKQVLGKVIQALEEKK